MYLLTALGESLRDPKRVIDYHSTLIKVICHLIVMWSYCYVYFYIQKENFDEFNVSEIVKVGSLGHGTAVPGNFDVDLIIYSRGIIFQD